MLSIRGAAPSETGACRILPRYTKTNFLGTSKSPAGILERCPFLIFHFSMIYFCVLTSLQQHRIRPECSLRERFETLARAKYIIELCDKKDIILLCFLRSSENSKAGMVWLRSSQERRVSAQLKLCRAGIKQAVRQKAK